ncbi:hypothetical protein [Pinibacter soli]|uniref:Uncharacterized protein n=1 Tax=Pinibacter soli TaxID=3044211 RepID=A0ABT6RIH1_9BACT|nr:hypothetical protein [Pinibacter soli]MDI3322370.1 hypothetical protein [Pinibacter soli]
MNLIELKDKLYWNNVPERWYSLNEGLKADACILYKNYSTWEFFYLDERGERHDYRIFNNDDEAFDFLWKKMEYQLAVFKIKPKER